jgi:uncharacterized protein (DUF1499 family)
MPDPPSRRSGVALALRPSKEILIMISSTSLFACAAAAPTDLGVNQMRLAPCPPSPNCVSSDSEDPARAVEPLRLAGPPADAWQYVFDEVSQLPNTKIVTREPQYLHAVCSSSLFDFADDFEFHLREDEGIIAVRSASRIGYSDLGVNRRRVEHLRERLANRGVVRGARGKKTVD